MSIARPSVQSLLITMRAGGKPLATGTGFVMNAPSGPALLTNWHNVTGRRPDTGALRHGVEPEELVILHNGVLDPTKPGELRWVPRLEPLRKPGGDPRWVEHPAHKQAVDAVALPLTELADVELYPYDPADNVPIAHGPTEIVSVVGFPFGLRGGGSLAIWATGFVASEPDVEGPLPVFLIDCRGRPGQSGSAVIAYRNGGAVMLENGAMMSGAGIACRLLGIYSGRVNDQSDLGFVWKLSAIEEILAACV